ncbi:MAG TPA: hypothetical protein VIW67_18310 [Terriglobales bacterium]|jgi:hypothetical protein
MFWKEQRFAAVDKKDLPTVSTLKYLRITHQKGPVGRVRQTLVRLGFKPQVDALDLAVADLFDRRLQIRVGARENDPFSLPVTCQAYHIDGDLHVDALFLEHEGSFNHSVFAKNYERVLSADVAKLFFAEVYDLSRQERWTSDAHFTADGTLIESWASLKSFVHKDGGDAAKVQAAKDEDPGNPSVDLRGEPRRNDTHLRVRPQLVRNR